MKKLAILSLVIAVIIFGGQSCTKRYCAAKYPPQSIVNTVIKEVEKTIIRDTTITVHVKGDTVKVTEIVYVDREGKINMKPVNKETERVNVTASIKDGKLQIDIVNKPLKIEVTLKKALVDRNYWKEKAESKQEAIKVNEKTWFDKFARKWFWITAPLLLIIIALYLRKLFS